MNAQRMRANLEAVRERIDQAARRSGRSAGDVRLVAVTKKNPPSLIQPLIDARHRDFGENYPQELWKKADALADQPIEWHLIGHLQTNKAKRTAKLVRMIHSVDSLKLLRLLDDLAERSSVAPEVCLQVNVSAEPAKHGWDPDGLIEEAEAIASCEHVPIRGLMTIAALGSSSEEARPAFVRLRELRDALRQRSGLKLPELSMGMTADFEAAIEEGATIVRVGSALFEGVEPE